jgi:hypothetical protein
MLVITPGMILEFIFVLMILSWFIWSSLEDKDK